jgi:hypothetical protein
MDALTLPHGTATSALKPITATIPMVNVLPLVEKTVSHTVLNATRLDQSRLLSVLNVRMDTTSTNSVVTVKNATTNVKLVTDQAVITVPHASLVSITKTQSAKSVT